MTDTPRPRALVLTWAGVPRAWLDALPLAAPGFGAALRSALVADVPAAPQAVATAWATLATGQPPEVHGVTARGCRPAVPAFWDALNRSGVSTAVVGWPNTQPAAPTDSIMVTDAFAAATGNDAAHWPLAPGSVEPPELRAALAGCRVHPAQLSDEQLAALVPGLSAGAAELLRDVVAQALTVRAAGAALAAGDADVTVVHWDAAARFAHKVLGLAAEAPLSPGEWAGLRAAAQGLLALLASLAADVAAAAGALTHLVLLSSHGTTLPAAVPAPQADISRWALAPGWVAACGGGVGTAGRPFVASPLDLAPTVLALACGTVPGGLPGLTHSERAAGTTVPQPEVPPAPPRSRPRAVWARPVTTPLPEAGVLVRPARDDEGDLIHRLLGSPEWEPGVTRTAFVAEGLRGQRVGAAVLSCLSWTGTPPGPPVRIGVLPTANRWVAAALAAAARREAAAWGMGAVYAHDAVDPGSEAAARWADLGFEVCESVARFEAPCAALQAELTGLVEALRVRGRVPLDADVVPLSDVPAEAVASLYRTELSDREPAAALARRVRGGGGGGDLGIDPRASAALVVDGALAGVALTRDEGGGVVFVEAFVLAPQFRGTWAAPLLRLEALDRATAAGFRTMRFDAGTQHHDTRKLAARIGAARLWERDRYRAAAATS